MTDEQGFDRLHEDDALALEALIDAGYDPAAVAPELRERARRVGELLGLLDADPGDWASSASVEGLVRRAAAAVPAVDAEPELCEADRSAVDAFVMEGHAAQRAPAALRVRAECVAAIGALLTGTPVAVDASARASLIERTMAAVDEAEVERADRMRFRPSGPRRTFGFRDLVGLASVACLAFALIVPVLGAVRHQQHMGVCSSNMSVAARAFGQYGLDHAGVLPMATAGLGGGVWWNVGRPAESNSANLFTLPRLGYAPLEAFACDGNPFAAERGEDVGDRDWRALRDVSYSYRVVYGARRPALPEGGTVVLMTDRSPVVLRAIAGEPFDPWANSPNHNGRGQHVLLSDGSAAFEKRAELASGDNLWLPSSLEAAIDRATRRAEGLRGRERPGLNEAAFVGP